MGTRAATRARTLTRDRIRRLIRSNPAQSIIEPSKSRIAQSTRSAGYCYYLLLDCRRCLPALTLLINSIVADKSNLVFVSVSAVVAELLTWRPLWQTCVATLVEQVRRQVHRYGAANIRSIRASDCIPVACVVGVEINERRRRRRRLN